MKRKRSVRKSSPPAITIAPPKREPVLPPDRYVLRTRIQYCTSCCRTHRATELFAETTLILNKTEVKRLQRVDTPEYSLPYTVRSAPLEQIAFCHECSDDSIYNYLTSLPPPPRPKEIVPLTWITETQRDEMLALRSERTTSRPAPRRATLEDLESL